MKLSEHFSLEELTVSETAARKGLDNTPDNDALFDLKRLALFLEEIRTAVGKPLRINSAYRAPEVNASVGGSKTSQHCKGQAADIRVTGMTPDQVVQAIITAKLPFDQVIREFDSWTHVSIAPQGKLPRKMALIIDKKGTRPYAPKKS
ncbi:Peptidase M15A, C-terminal [uncultured Caudovirales phage]|uniref:Peptidase M15A, C-terminal n=1 Tax=uncultured Caudovirales phage TaxID=2100421 RepID=A0A6J5M8A2_9CAUD|nr:Peptidase M15A, C-terminal [uncultured Caudovirales phage]CAB4157906.1 Peptidase M15A, C-terminal [uncultured Caudovirales phage]